MAKGSKKNKERAAAQANKARRVEKRKAVAPKAATPTSTTPEATATPTSTTPEATATPTRTKEQRQAGRDRRERQEKLTIRSKKKENAEIREQNKAGNKNKEANNFNASLTIDGKDFSYRDPKNLNTYSSSRKLDNRSGPFDGANSNAYEYTNPLYQYSEGRISDAASALGIGNVNSKKEVDRILSQIRNPQIAALPQINTPNNNNKKNKKNKNNRRDNEPLDAETVEPAPDNRIQELQDSFKEQISGLMDSMSGYQQQFLDQQANYDQKMLDMRNTLSAQMNPQRRNPIFGVRTPGMGGVARNIRNSFGRGGSRIGGIRNTTLNLS